MLAVHNPFTLALAAEIPLTKPDEIERYFAEAARLAADSDARLPAYRRREILLKAAAIVEANREEIAREASLEGGKPILDSRVEIDRAVVTLRESAAGIDRLTGTEIPMGLTPGSVNRLAYTRREPIGFVLAYSAFNHPFNLVAHQCAPAIAAGCPIVLKPAPATPLSALRFAKILREAGLPEAWCRTIVVDNETAERLVQDPRVNYFSFIGSARVGWKLRAKLAPGARAGFEHGGAAPVLVEADADLADALPLLAKGGFYHAGQACISVQRVFAHESIARDVADRLAAIAAELAIGDPFLEDTEVGPLIRPSEVARIADWVEEAAPGGKGVLAGGEALGETCYAPTVLFDPPAAARISREEIFGPVVAVYPYADRRAAIARANSLPYAFQSAVFTKNIDVALECARRFDAATVLVNDHTAFRVDWMPFAGRKQSGLGTGGVPFTLREYTEEKLVILRSKSL